MRPSVIISTYNQPDWLEKVLWGFAAQTVSDFEVVVADDGSNDETTRRIERLRRETSLHIRHVWHEDRGFRKCMILNQAILAASGDYLIFTDGDCIPRADFVAQHLRLARPGYFLSGGYFKLPLPVSQAITRDDVQSGRATDAAWLVKQGVGLGLKLWKLFAGPRTAWWLDQLTTTRASWNGHNASTWKESLLKVNGFDERMEWGGEDRELGERLIHAGLKSLRIRYRAVCVHLEHGRGYVREEALRRNLQIRAETARTRAVQTPFGIRPLDAARETMQDRAA